MTRENFRERLINVLEPVVKSKTNGSGFNLKVQDGGTLLNQILCDRPRRVTEDRKLLKNISKCRGVFFSLHKLKTKLLSGSQTG